MGGIAILLIVAGYLALSVWLVVKVPWRWKPVVLVAAVLVPSADSLWAHYVTMPRVCKDAGLKVYGKADKAGGLRLSTADESWVTKHGFPFVEGEGAPGRYYRISMQGDRIVREQEVQPKARYLSESQGVSPARGIRGTIYRVRDVTTGQVLGELVDFGYGGGWAERFLASFTDSGPGPIFLNSCDVGPFSPTRLLRTLFDLGE
jgi:hypothetical protein